MASQQSRGPCSARNVAATMSRPPSQPGAESTSPPTPTARAAATPGSIVMITLQWSQGTLRPRLHHEPRAGWPPGPGTPPNTRRLRSAGRASCWVTPAVAAASAVATSTDSAVSPVRVGLGGPLTEPGDVPGEAGGASQGEQRAGGQGAGAAAGEQTDPHRRQPHRSPAAAAHPLTEDQRGDHRGEQDLAAGEEAGHTGRGRLEPDRLQQEARAEHQSEHRCPPPLHRRQGDHPRPQGDENRCGDAEPPGQERPGGQVLDRSGDPLVTRKVEPQTVVAATRARTAAPRLAVSPARNGHTAQNGAGRGRDPVVDECSPLRQPIDPPDDHSGPTGLWTT